jgi:hypothetical protein
VYGDGGADAFTMDDGFHDYVDGGVGFSGHADLAAEAGADVVVVYPVPVLEPVSSIMATLFGLAPRPSVEA